MQMLNLTAIRTLQS